MFPVVEANVPAVPLVGVFTIMRFPSEPFAVQPATVVVTLTGIVIVDATVFVLEIMLNVFVPVIV
jgi:hypothetical protein